MAFYAGLGFDLMPGDVVIDGIPIHRDYDGPGLDRVVERTAQKIMSF